MFMVLLGIRLRHPACGSAHGLEGLTDRQTGRSDYNLMQCWVEGPHHALSNCKDPTKARAKLDLTQHHQII
jgi:hypothetical protein